MAPRANDAAELYLHNVPKSLPISVYAPNVLMNGVDHMALLSELVSICAEKKLDTESTLAVFARRLREARRLTQAGRGRGAAHMSFLDASRFLIACAATDHPERAVDAESVFSNLVLRHGSRDEDFVLNDDEAPTLDLALAKVLKALSDGDIDRFAAEQWARANPGGRSGGEAFLWLTLRRGGGSAYLRVLGGSYIYYHPALAAVMDSVDARSHEATKIAEASFERETLRFRDAKNLTAELQIGLLRAVATLIAAPRKIGERNAQ